MNNELPQKVSQLEAQLNELEMQLKRYDELIMRAGARLSSILTEDKKETKAEEKGHIVQLVPAAAKLHTAVLIFMDINNRFERLIERAEN